MQTNEVPFECHVLVCVNERAGSCKSCGDHVGISIKEQLKAGVADRGLRPRVRVSQTGCLGVCAKGPNVFVYPHKRWFSHVEEADVPLILDAVEELVKAL